MDVPASDNDGTALDATALKTALGGLDDAELNAAFSDAAVPTATGAATLSTAGLDYVDDLFRADSIEITNTLPTELL